MNRRKQFEGKEHITAYAKINACKTCVDCPLRVFAKEDDNVVLGIGNIFAKQWIVLPTYNTKCATYKTRLDVLIDVYKELTDRELREDFYITRDIKCINPSSYLLYHAAKDSCAHFLRYEYIKLHPQNIVWFSDNLYECPFENSTTITSCAVMFYDDDKLKERFKQEFMNAISGYD